MRRSVQYSAFILAAAAVMAVAVQADAGESKAGEYLSEYFHAEPFSLDDPDSVNAALTALGGDAIAEEDLNYESVVAEGIRLAGLEELALSYANDANPQKGGDVLSREGVEAEHEEYVPYLAAALDLGLLEDGGTGSMDMEEYLYRCMEIGGKARRYIGRISDDSILSELQTVLNESVLFDEESLSDIGSDIVLSGITTGYGLKCNNYDARFLADYTIRYGHSDIRHAVQLVGLLRSEGIDGYIQIEPKVSVYEYMTDWGDPGEPTPTYAVLEVEEGRFLCYATEYDLEIEFDTKEEKEDFHRIIEDYAKIYDDRVDEDGNITAKLLAESWWQPLYSSTTPMENEEFGELVDNVVYDRSGAYSIHSFSLPEKSAEIVEKVKTLAPDLEVNPVTIYVNPAFIRYITGDDYQ